MNLIEFLDTEPPDIVAEQPNLEGEFKSAVNDDNAPTCLRAVVCRAKILMGTRSLWKSMMKTFWLMDPTPVDRDQLRCVYVFEQHDALRKRQWHGLNGSCCFFFSGLQTMEPGKRGSNCKTSSWRTSHLAHAKTMSCNHGSYSRKNEGRCTVENPLYAKGCARFVVPGHENPDVLDLLDIRKDSPMAWLQCWKTKKNRSGETRGRDLKKQRHLVESSNESKEMEKLKRIRALFTKQLRPTASTIPQHFHSLLHKRPTTHLTRANTSKIYRKVRVYCRV